MSQFCFGVFAWVRWKKQKNNGEAQVWVYDWILKCFWCLSSLMHYNTRLYFTKSFITDLKNKQTNNPLTLLAHLTRDFDQSTPLSVNYMKTCWLPIDNIPFPRNVVNWLMLKLLFDASAGPVECVPADGYHWEVDQAISSTLFPSMGIWLKSGWG